LAKLAYATALKVVGATHESSNLSGAIKKKLGSMSNFFY